MNGFIVVSLVIAYLYQIRQCFYNVLEIKVIFLSFFLSLDLRVLN